MKGVVKSQEGNNKTDVSLLFFACWKLVARRPRPPKGVGNKRKKKNSQPAREVRLLGEEEEDGRER